MQVGDLVRVRKGFFMQGLMGIVVSELNPTRMGGHKLLYVRLIGDVPTALKRKSSIVRYRPDRLILIKSSNDRDQ